MAAPVAGSSETSDAPMDVDDPPGRRLDAQRWPCGAAHGRRPPCAHRPGDRDGRAHGLPHRARASIRSRRKVRTAPRSGSTPPGSAIPSTACRRGAGWITGGDLVPRRRRVGDRRAPAAAAEGGVDRRPDVPATATSTCDLPLHVGARRGRPRARRPPRRSLLGPRRRAAAASVRRATSSDSRLLVGQAHRPVEGLRSEPDDAVAAHGVIVVPELDVDELVGAVAGQPAHHELPQVLPGGPPRSRRSGAAHSPMVTPSWATSHGTRARRRVSRAWALIAAVRSPVGGEHGSTGPSRTAATASGGPTTVASEPAAQASEASWSSEPADTVNSSAGPGVGALGGDGEPPQRTLPDPARARTRAWTCSSPPGPDGVGTRRRSPRAAGRPPRPPRR